MQSINHVYFRHNGPYDRKTDRIEKFKNNSVRKNERFDKVTGVYTFKNLRIGPNVITASALNSMLSSPKVKVHL